MNPTGELETRLAIAWASGSDLRTLEALARETLVRGQALALPLCVLGHTALARNDLHAARMLFRRALVADSALLDAQRGALIVERRLRGKPSLLGAVRALLAL